MLPLIYSLISVFTVICICRTYSCGCSPACANTHRTIKQSIAECYWCTHTVSVNRSVLLSFLVWFICLSGCAAGLFTHSSWFFSREIKSKRGSRWGRWEVCNGPQTSDSETQWKDSEAKQGLTDTDSSWNDDTKRRKSPSVSVKYVTYVDSCWNGGSVYYVICSFPSAVVKICES